ncbi:hypothetical protein HDU90_008342 [Geranomyces variabilis]|nr:hypothetical protein HDU90_008342 [Geranomyces variabilis]
MSANNRLSRSPLVSPPPSSDDGSSHYSYQPQPPLPMTEQHHSSSPVPHYQEEQFDGQALDEDHYYEQPAFSHFSHPHQRQHQAHFSPEPVPVPVQHVPRPWDSENVEAAGMTSMHPVRQAHHQFAKFHRGGGGGGGGGATIKSSSHSAFGFKLRDIVWFIAYVAACFAGIGIVGLAGLGSFAVAMAPWWIAHGRARIVWMERRRRCARRSVGLWKGDFERPILGYDDHHLSGVRVGFGPLLQFTIGKGTLSGSGSVNARVLNIATNGMSNSKNSGGRPASEAMLASASSHEWMPINRDSDMVAAAIPDTDTLSVYIVDKLVTKTRATCMPVQARDSFVLMPPPPP